MASRRILGLAIVGALVLGVVAAPGPAHRGTFPGRNGKLAFALGGELSTVNPDGSDKRLVIGRARGFVPASPAWAPDGNRIAFQNSIGSTGGIWYVNADGSSPQRVTTDQNDREPAWSPDGRRLVFVRNAGGRDRLFVVNADGSGLTNITTALTVNALEPSWSPDGSRIAFTDLSRIYLVNADGSGFRQLTGAESGNAAYPNWSPDGSRIAFASGPASVGAIRVVQPDGGGLGVLVPGLAEVWEVAWSPDGTKLAFSQDVGGPLQEELWTANADGSGVTRLNIDASTNVDWGVGQQVGNLLANPGAEVGPGAPDSSARPAIPSWQTTSTFTAVQYGAPSFPTTAQSARIGGGVNFFAGGPGGALSTASQTVDVSSQASAIDAGRVGATLSGLLGGFASQGDSATVTATFQGGAGAALGQATIGPVTPAERNNQTALLPRTTTTLVPAGTRRIQVVLTAKREEGSYNDGYLDNISLVLGPPPVPVAGVSVNVAPAGGVVLVRLRGTNRFVNLKSLRNVPVGSEFDVRRGRVRLVSAAGGRRTQTATFYQGRAVVRQVRARVPVTTLQLSGPLVCPKRKPSAVGAKKPPRVRRLWGSGKGRFRTRGKYASATVRGTVWLTEDRCDGTLVRVRSGRVEVNDLVAKRRVVIRGGQSYLAKARR